MLTDGTVMTFDQTKLILLMENTANEQYDFYVF